jgi:hypothetical protein
MRTLLIAYLQIPGDDIDPVVVGIVLPGRGLQGIQGRIEEEVEDGLAALKKKIDEDLSKRKRGRESILW